MNTCRSAVLQKNIGRKGRVTCPPPLMEVSPHASPTDYFLQLKSYRQQMLQNPTPTEKKLFQFLKDNQIPFKPQAIVFPYIVDFLLWEKSIALELDGGHHDNLSQLQYDTNRDVKLSELGILTIRIRNNDFDKYKDIVIEHYTNRQNRKCDVIVGRHNQQSISNRDHDIIVHRFDKHFCKELHKILYKGLRRRLSIALLVLITICAGMGGNAQALTASYYTKASCLREGTSGIMANGKELDDEAFTCASWDYKFGTRLRITNKLNDRKVVVSVTDRGPNKKLYRKGRTIDLSKAAMVALDGVKQGVIPIEVEVL